MPCSTCDYYSDGPDPEFPNTSTGVCCANMGEKGLSCPLTAREAATGCADHSQRETRGAAASLAADLLPMVREWIDSLNTVPPCPNVVFDPPKDPGV